MKHLLCVLGFHNWDLITSRSRGCRRCSARQKHKYFLDEDRWIDFSDDCPGVGSEVLTWDKHCGCEVRQIDSYILACITGEEYSHTYETITHWMPLPEPPQ